MFFLLSLYYHAYLHSFLGLSETFVCYRHLVHLTEHETRPMDCLESALTATCGFARPVLLLILLVNQKSLSSYLQCPSYALIT